MVDQIRQVGFTNCMANFKATLEERKADSTLQQLFKVARLLNEQAIDAFNAKNSSAFRYRPSHMSLFPHLSLEGSRITQLAEAMQISKQAVGQLVEELEQVGIVCRVPDPSDGRAKLVQFTASGRKAMLQGLRLLKRMEEDLAAVIGVRRLKELGTTLGRLLEHLDEDSGKS